MVKGHGGHFRMEKAHGSQCGEPQPMPGKLRRQQHPKPEIGKKHDGAAEGKGAGDPWEVPCCTTGGEGEGEDQPFPPAQLQKQCRTRQPEAQAQQIPENPPGGMPLGLPQQHGGTLAAQIGWSHPPELADAAAAVRQKHTRHESKQGHMEQVDQPVEPIDLRVSQVRFNQMPQKNQEHEK